MHSCVIVRSDRGYCLPLVLLASRFLWTGCFLSVSAWWTASLFFLDGASCIGAVCGALRVQAGVGAGPRVADARSLMETTPGAATRMTMPPRDPRAPGGARRRCTSAGVSPLGFSGGGPGFAPTCRLSMDRLAFGASAQAPRGANASVSPAKSQGFDASC